MALTTGTIWELRENATTGNVNGAGFNILNANFPTNATATSATGDSPVISSATYTFVAGDVGAWVYIKSGTNWTPGFYQIASVTAGAATVSAAIGQAVQIENGRYSSNTVAGVATTASPTGGTYGVDYSQQDTAVIDARADFGATGGSTTLTSAGGGFHVAMVGNIYHQTTTGTGGFGIVGWYEIISFTSATAIVLDRTPNTGTASVACTGYIGGAGRLNALEDPFFEMVPAGSRIWISGTHSASGAVNVASTNSTATSPTRVQGYASIRGDKPIGSTRPTIAMGSSVFTAGQFQIFDYVMFSGTGVNVFVTGTGTTNKYLKSLNSSTAAGRNAIATANSTILFCEATSQNGVAIAITNNSRPYYCYAHDSDIGYLVSGNNCAVIACLSANNITAAIDITGSTTNTTSILGNTLYGSESKVGVGIRIAATSAGVSIFNNIIYGFVTGISKTTQQDSNIVDYNDFFNNTTDVSNIEKGRNDIALDPQFVSLTQVSGTTATTSGSVLTQSGGDFSTIEDNVDYLRVVSGTSVTVGIYLITSHTATTLTVNNALGTSVAGNVVYSIPTGSNFAIGTNLKAQGFPSLIIGSETTNYLDMGASQRQEGPTARAVIVQAGTY